MSDVSRSVKKPRLLTPSQSFSDRIRTLEEDNQTMKKQLDQWIETANAANKIQNTLEASLSSAQATISQLKEHEHVMHENAKKSEALIIHYKSKSQGLGKCVADIAATVRRVEKQEREALTPPPTIMK